MPANELIRRDPVVRYVWLKTVAASLSAVAMAGSPALANPALMAARQPAVKEQVAANPAPRTVASLQADPARPSAQISPWRNPVKYLSASISEMPFGSYGKKASANAVASPATHNDSIALDKPVGPPTPELLISLAQMSESKGDVAQARAHYQQALNMWPGNVEVLRAAARMEDRLGQMSVAENLYNQAVAANPGHAGALNDLGLCLARQGKLDASVQVLEQAIQLQPEKPLYRNNAATVLVEMREDHRALAHLAAVHASADANYNFGQLLVQRGRPADAAPYFQAAVDQNPQLQHAHVALAKLRGEQVPATTSYAPSTTSPPQAPAAQHVAPTYAPQNGPTLTYPATATAPGYNTSSSMPTRYLPPIATRPSPVQR
jgi:tetratricopeptide (TPR) repeat protein